MSSEEEKYGAPKQNNHASRRINIRKKKNQDLGRKIYMQDFFSKAEEKPYTQGKVIKRKEPITSQKLISLDTFVQGKEIEFKEASEISPKIYDLSVVA